MKDFQLYTAAACRAIDAQAMLPVADGGMGLSGQMLMQRAAKFALDRLLALRPQMSAMTIFCGKGNNAGDGYQLGLLAHKLGITVQFIAVGPVAQLAGDALTACARAQSQGLILEPADSPIRHPVIVDALLGTGFRDQPRTEYAAAITQINQAQAFVLSIDLPSGLNADSGAADCAVSADATVSFIARKIGLYTAKGPSLSGQRLFTDLGVSAKMAAGHAPVELRHWRPDLLESIPVDAYKHQRGHVLVVGGDVGMGGAVVLAAEAALRSGAGLVSVATAAENRSGLLARLPEAMWVDPLRDDTGQGIVHVLSRADVLVLGPGLGRSEWAARVLKSVSGFQGPMVIDADGLFWLADHASWLQLGMAHGSLFMTPHGAEAARLLERPIEKIMNNPRQAIADMAERFSATCLLKGPGSVMGDAQIQTICAHGNPGMATAGMGDVLAGLAGSLIAQQPGQEQTAFCAAVLLHSAAADRAAQEIGMRGLTASAVVPKVEALLYQAPDCVQ